VPQQGKSATMPRAESATCRSPSGFPDHVALPFRKPEGDRAGRGVSSTAHCAWCNALRATRPRWPGTSARGPPRTSRSASSSSPTSSWGRTRASRGFVRERTERTSARPNRAPRRRQQRGAHRWAGDPDAPAEAMDAGTAFPRVTCPALSWFASSSSSDEEDGSPSHHPHHRAAQSIATSGTGPAFRGPLGP
jgi:hypothetical protein